MKSIVFVFWVLLWLAASLGAQTSSVEGIVVDQITGQPLSNAHVRVLTGDVATVSVERVYGAISDGTGHFSVSGMLPGLYLVVPERSGFIFVRPPGPIPATVLALREGQHVTGQKVEMTPLSSVSGHVTDDAGEPVRGVSMQVRSAPPDADFVNPFAMALPYYSDDHGEFHIVVAPGNYYVQAMPRNYVQPGPAGPYVATWFPNADSLAQAAAVQVRPGQDVSADIHLAHGAAAGPAASAPPLSISGVVTGLPERGPAMVTLLRRANSGTMQPFRMGVVDPTGKFTLRGVPTGNYKMFAQYAPGKLQSRVVDVQLAGADLSNQQFSLAPGEELAGSLEISGEPVSATQARRVTVKLESAEPNGPGTPETAAAEVGKDGTFRIPAVFPGRYRIRTESLPDGAFISAVTMDGVKLDGGAVDDTGFELLQAGAGARLKITISRNAGQMSGMVLNHEGAPLTSPLAAVLVWKNSAQLVPDQNAVSASRYALRNLRPGKYRVLAVDAFDFTNLAGANDLNEFAKALQAASEEIEVEEGAHLVKDLKVLAKEDIHVGLK